MPNTPAACTGCGEPEPTTGSYFVSAYPPFDAWSEAGLPAYREILAAEPPPETPLGLYLHVPFCERRCDYCYYLAYDDQGPEIDHYLDAVAKELSACAGCRYLAQRRLDFVYIGGGTPSLLSSERLGRLISAIAGAFDPSEAREVTFECAPRSVTAAKLRLLRDSGVSRLSMGVQQLDDRVLRANGRLHLVADIERAWAAIRATGFDVVNLDLIVGLRGETDESFFGSLERTLELAPESLTLYQLEIPHNTPLFRDLGGEAAPPPEDLPGWETKRRRLGRAFDRLADAGYTRRSAYTAVRDPERHAFLYQDLQYNGADLLGIGASSFSYLGGVHHQNRASLSGYLESIDAGSLPLGRAYALDPDERLIRRMVLQLKLGRVDLAALGEEFAVDVGRRFADPLAELESDGCAIVEPDRVQVSSRGLARIDRLLPLFYRSSDQPGTNRRPAGAPAASVEDRRPTF